MNSTPHAGHDQHASGRREHGAASRDAHHVDHDKHEGHSPGMFRDRFWLSLAFTIPVVVWSAHIQELLSFRAPEFRGSTWIPPVLGTVVFLYGGLVFLRAGRVPARGEVVAHESGVQFEIVDADPRRIKRLRVRLPSSSPGLA